MGGAPVRKSCGIRCNAIDDSAVGLKDGRDRLRVPLECCQQGADALAIQRLNSIVRLRFKVDSLLVTIAGEVPGGFDEAQRLSGSGWRPNGSAGAQELQQVRFVRKFARIFRKKLTAAPHAGDSFWPRVDSPNATEFIGCCRDSAPEAAEVTACLAALEPDPPEQPDSEQPDSEQAE